MLLKNVCIFMLLMVPGWILGKKGRIGEGAVSVFGDLLGNIAMPALVFCKLIELDPSAVRVEYLIICIAMPFIVIPLGCLFVRLFCIKDPSIAASSKFCAVFSNCGFLGIPMAVAIFPSNPEVALYVSLFNLSSTYMLLTLGVSILSRSSAKINLKKLFLTPVTVCILLGGLVHLFGVTEYVTTLTSYASYFAALTTPLSMIVLGYELSKLSLSDIFACRLMYPTAAVKLIFSPLVALAVLLLVDLIPSVNINGELASAMLLSAGISTAASAPALAQKNGADVPHTAVFTLGSTLLCMITLPLLWLLFEFLF